MERPASGGHQATKEEILNRKDCSCFIKIRISGSHASISHRNLQRGHGGQAHRFVTEELFWRSGQGRPSHDRRGTRSGQQRRFHKLGQKTHAILKNQAPTVTYLLQGAFPGHTDCGHSAPTSCLTYCDNLPWLSPDPTPPARPAHRNGPTLHEMGPGCHLRILTS